MKKMYFILPALALFFLVGFGCTAQNEIQEDPVLDADTEVEMSDTKIENLGFTLNDALSWGELEQQSEGCPSSWTFSDIEDVTYYSAVSNCTAARSAYYADITGYLENTAHEYRFVTPYFDKDFDQALVVDEYDVDGGEVLIVRGVTSTGPSVIPIEGMYAVIVNTPNGDATGGVFIFNKGFKYEGIEWLIKNIVYDAS